jgi:hypothetical protein
MKSINPKLISALHTRDGRLVLVFIIFVAIQFLFAWLYFWLYRKNRRNFSFNSEILKQQSAVTREHDEREVPRLETAISVFCEVTAELERGAIPLVEMRKSASLELPSGHKCIAWLLHGPKGPAGTNFEISDNSGVILFEVMQPERPGWRGFLESKRWVTDVDEWKADVALLLEQTRLRLTKTRVRIASLESTTPDVWSYWDFLYFSTILQTTVGLGDILPNSTAVRMVVTAQIMIGYALLIVVLNIVLG